MKVTYNTKARLVRLWIVFRISYFVFLKSEIPLTLKLSFGFGCLSFVGEKRLSAKVENDGQVHDFIDQKCFLIEGKCFLR